MGRALIHSIQAVLGNRFTEEIKDAWVEVYGALSYDMIRAKRQNNSVKNYFAQITVHNLLNSFESHKKH